MKKKGATGSSFFGAYKSLVECLNKNDRKQLVYAFVSSLFYVIQSIIPAQIISVLLSKILGQQIELFGFKIHENLPVWQWLLIGICLVLVIRFLYMIFNRKLWVICERTSYSVRETAFSWALIPRKNLDLKMSTGDVINRVNSASTATGSTIKETFAHVLPQAMSGIFAIVFIFIINYWCGLICIVAILLSLLCAVWRAKRERRIMNLAEIQKSENSSYIVNTLQNINVVQLYGNAELEKTKFNEKNEKYLGYYEAHSKVWAFYWFLSAMIRYGTTFAIFAVAIFVSNAVNIGSLYVILSYLNLLFDPVQSLGWLIGEVIQEGIALDRMKELKPENSEILSLEMHPKLKNKPIESIKLENVVVEYGENKRVKNINLNLAKNKITLLKGVSGKGKTTALRVLCGITEKKSGNIFVNGVLVENMFPYISKISVAMQGESVFNRSVAENIFYAEKRISKTKQDEVLKTLNIEKLKERSFDKQIGTEMPNKLSGGEKKRINISRALIKKADVYVFDEPTNELDDANTKKVIELITRLKKSAVVFVISHDARLVQAADEVAVMR